MDSTANPATLYPNTTWSKIENRFLYGSASPSATGRRSSVALALANIPVHNHSATQGSHTHTANHNHTATQASHLHSQPGHFHTSTSKSIDTYGAGNWSVAPNFTVYQNSKGNATLNTDTKGGDNT